MLLLIILLIYVRYFVVMGEIAGFVIMIFTLGVLIYNMFELLFGIFCKIKGIFQKNITVFAKKLLKASHKMLYNIVNKRTSSVNSKKGVRKCET